MSGARLEQKALNLLKTFEGAGKTVLRVVVDGRRIEIELASGNTSDEFDGIDMRHDKT